MKINILLSLSESDKRLIFVLILVILLALAILGILSYLIVKLIKHQGKKADTLVHDVVVTKVITDSRHFKSYARKKNWAKFFKQAYIPVIICVVGIIVWIIKCAIIKDFSYNPFNTKDGFGTIFYTFRYSNEYTGGFLIRFNKLVVDNYPHMVKEGWAGYICGPLFIVSTLWYLGVVTALIGRSIKLRKRASTLFEKSLDGYNQSKALDSMVDQDNSTGQQNNLNN